MGQKSTREIAESADSAVGMAQDTVGAGTSAPKRMICASSRPQPAPPSSAQSRRSGRMVAQVNVTFGD